MCIKSTSCHESTLAAENAPFSDALHNSHGRANTQIHDTYLVIISSVFSTQIHSKYFQLQEPQIQTNKLLLQKQWWAFCPAFPSYYRLRQFLFPMPNQWWHTQHWTCIQPNEIKTIIRIPIWIHHNGKFKLHYSIYSKAQTSNEKCTKMAIYKNVKQWKCTIKYTMFTKFH